MGSDSATAQEYARREALAYDAYHRLRPYVKQYENSVEIQELDSGFDCGEYYSAMYWLLLSIFEHNTYVPLDEMQRDIAILVGDDLQEAQACFKEWKPIR